ncbi:NUDIX domain-containing protein [Pseudarthrobacter sp. N5]|uniref:NUDIX domain-containing protein n=1 Tax=Pseudarthrobacter sp. N5 TaxID=3418416 RepID=UPI003CEB1F0C
MVTRRKLSKTTWPGVWTNSFCGHPAPDEPFEDAIRRRARHQLRIEICEPESVLPDFPYRAVDSSGISPAVAGRLVTKRKLARLVTLGSRRGQTTAIDPGIRLADAGPGGRLPRVSDGLCGVPQPSTTAPNR